MVHLPNCVNGPVISLGAEVWGAGVGELSCLFLTCRSCDRAVEGTGAVGIPQTDQRIV